MDFRCPSLIPIIDTVLESVEVKIIVIDRD